MLAAPGGPTGGGGAATRGAGGRMRPGSMPWRTRRVRFCGYRAGSTANFTRSRNDRRPFATLPA